MIKKQATATDNLGYKAYRLQNTRSSQSFELLTALSTYTVSNTHARMHAHTHTHVHTHTHTHTHTFKFCKLNICTNIFHTQLLCYKPITT